jgi:membrane protein implicated in regulation of membrane protease activity
LTGLGLDVYFGPELSWLTGAVLVLPLAACAFTFKLAFTIKDAPELTTSIPKGLVELVVTLPLVELARVVFAGLGILLALCLAKWAFALQSHTQKQAEARNSSATGKEGFIRQSIPIPGSPKAAEAPLTWCRSRRHHIRCHNALSHDANESAKYPFVSDLYTASMVPM